jgi:hypothetical protein
MEPAGEDDDEFEDALDGGDDDFQEPLDSEASKLVDEVQFKDIEGEDQYDEIITSGN